MLHKRRLNSMKPIDISQVNSDGVENRIIDTIRSADLDPQQYMLVGSAALTLYGIDLINHQTNLQRPHDVDLAVTAALYKELLENKQSPSGLRVGTKKKYVGNFIPGNSQHILQARPDKIDSSLLPIDLITRYKSDFTVDEYDAGVRRHFDKNSHTIPGTNGIRIASLGHIATELVRNSNRGDVQFDNDLYAVKKFTSRR